nr:hypothetical protein [uncultured Agathobaculum sp.]
MYKDLDFEPSELIFYKKGSTFEECVRYVPFPLSFIPPAERPDINDPIFSNKPRPFAAELHTVLKRYEEIVNESVALGKRAITNLKPLRHTTYQIADHMLAGYDVSEIFRAQRNLFALKNYLFLQDTEYKTLPTRYWDFLSSIDSIDVPRKSIFSYVPKSAPFSFEYNDLIPTQVIPALEDHMPITAESASYFNFHAYNTTCDAPKTPVNETEERADKDAYFTAPFLNLPPDDLRVEEYPIDAATLEYTQRKMQYSHDISSARVYLTKNLWEYCCATLDFAAKQRIRLRKCACCGKYFVISTHASARKYCSNTCSEIIAKKSRKLLEETDKIYKRIDSMLQERIRNYKPKPGMPLENYEDMENLEKFREERTMMRRRYKRREIPKEEYVDWLTAQHKKYIRQPKNPEKK